VASCIPLVSQIKPVESAQQFAEFVAAQTDLTEEAHNLLQFRRNFRDREDCVGFPRPVLWTPGLLVETLEHGVSIGECLRSFAHEDQKRIGAVSLRAFLQMVLVDNFVHSDLHPGNMLVQHGHDIKPRLVYLDTGLATTLSEHDLRNFVDLFTAVATSNGHRAARLMIERSDNTHLSDDEADGFVAGVTQIVSDVELTSFKLANVQIGSVLERMMGLVRKYRVNLDPSFTSLVVSIVLLEGIGRQLDADIDIFSTALPILYRTNPRVRNEIASALGVAWIKKHHLG
jgi:aarF domain-containing kinase